MFHEKNSQWLFGGVDLGRKPRKNLRMELKQINRSRKQSFARLPIEADNEIELIDLSNLTGITSKEDAELLDLNRRLAINHPAKWEINGSGGSRKIYQDGSIELNEKGTSPYHEIYPKCDTQRHDLCSKYRAPPYRTITGACVRPTQISSLLSQNIDGVTRSPNFCYKWDQTDEGYYRAEAKKGLPEFIASTRENYYCIPDVSIYRGRFICPKNEKNLFQGSGAVEHVNSSASYDDDYVPYWYDDENWAPPTPEWKKGDILVYVHPKTGQAEFYCP